MNIDEAGLKRLMGYARDAIKQQPPHIADQLDAAMREGRTRLEFQTIDGDLWALVEIDGNRVAQVDVRNLVPLDEL